MDLVKVLEILERLHRKYYEEELEEIREQHEEDMQGLSGIYSEFTKRTPQLIVLLPKIPTVKRNLRKKRMVETIPEHSDVKESSNTAMSEAAAATAAAAAAAAESASTKQEISISTDLPNNNSITSLAGLKCTMPNGSQYHEKCKKTALSAHNVSSTSAPSGSRGFAVSISSKRRLLTVQRGLEEIREKKEADLKRRIEREEEARKNREEKLKEEVEEKRRKREERMQRVLKSREAREKQKEEKLRQIIQNQEDKMKEHVQQKKQHAQKKATEIEERRKQEEAACLAKLKEQTETELRAAPNEVAILNRTFNVLPSSSNSDERNAPKKMVNVDDYGIDSSGESSEDEERPKRPVPLWARKAEWLETLKKQAWVPKELIEAHFACEEKRQI